MAPGTDNPDTGATGPQRGGAAEDAERYKRDAVRIVVRPMASPMALAFLGVGAASLVLSGLQLGWDPQQQGTYVAVALSAFAFPLQFLASVFGFLGRDAVATTGMGLLACSWLVTGAVTYLAPPGATNPVLGVFLLFAGAALLVPATGAVLFLAGLRFLLTDAYQLTGAADVQYVADGTCPCPCSRGKDHTLWEPYPGKARKSIGRMGSV